MLAADMRAYHFIHATDKIFDDFLAYDLISDEKRVQIEQHLIEYYLSEESNNSEHVHNSPTKLLHRCTLLK